MDRLRSLLAEEYTFAGQIHHFAFAKNQEQVVTHQIEIFTKEDALEELRYRLGAINDDFNDYGTFARPIVGRRQVINITSIDEIPVNNKCVYSIIDINILPMDFIHDIGEKELLGTVLVIESPASVRYKRRHDNTTVIGSIGNFDRRNYKMLPDCDKKKSMLDSLHDYYLTKYPGYYDGIQSIIIKQSLNCFPTIHTNNVYYGNDVYDQYYNQSKRRNGNNNDASFGDEHQISDSRLSRASDKYAPTLYKPTSEQLARSLKKTECQLVSKDELEITTGVENIHINKI